MHAKLLWVKCSNVEGHFSTAARTYLARVRVYLEFWSICSELSIVLSIRTLSGAWSHSLYDGISWYTLLVREITCLGMTVLVVFFKELITCCLTRPRARERYCLNLTR